MKKRKSMKGTGFLDSAIGFAKDHKLLSKGASMIPVIGGPLGGLLNMFGFGKRRGKGHVERTAMDGDGRRRRHHRGRGLLPSQVGVNYQMMGATSGGTVGLGRMSGHKSMRV